MNLWQFLGSLHPKLVHFPLALLLGGLLFDLAGLLWRSDKCLWAGKILSVAGTVSLLGAFICGIYAEFFAARAGIPQDQIELHELSANIASWGFVILVCWRLFLKAEHRKSLAAYVAIGLAWYGIMLVTAWLGGNLIMDYGAGVTGARAMSGLSIHDLNTLATRQTQLNLDYSEWMHHIFGYLTLALAGSLLVHAIFPMQGRKLKWVGPALLLAGGIFLFFAADLDLYRFTDLRQFRDREVQMHKLVAILLATIGAMGLWRLKRKPAVEEESRESAGGYQGKMVAVMALIGGGLLFTHIHTVAPYANVAAGVYVAHITLGTIALLIGGTRLLADEWPRRRRALSIAFSLLMCVEAILLLTYNEGLPWYLGYGRYTRTGPHLGAIAPYGSVRAEITFNNDSQTIDVYILDRFDDKKPVAVAASNLNLLIDQGYQELAVPIHAADAAGDNEHSHFTASAPSLKDVPAFCARLELPIGSGTKMGYFDPWVTPAIAAIPPNEVARYQCPMHEGIRSTDPGKCPLCGMSLIPIIKGVRTTLHDPEYKMDFSQTMGGNASSRFLNFKPMRDGRIMTGNELAITHEHLLHLIIVSADLKFFDHVHPVLQSDGSLTMEYSFPSPGSYVLFADITPSGSRNQVFRFEVQVGNGVTPPAVLEPSPAWAMPLPQDPSITAELVSTPRTLSAGLHMDLLVRLTRDGQPVTDLEPYLGAMGHCVIISQDTEMYMHCHPQQLRVSAAEDRGGPDIVFHARFPRAGRYKMFAQFKRNGKMLLVEYVLDVGNPILPAGLLNRLLDE